MTSEHPSAQAPAPNAPDFPPGTPPESIALPRSGYSLRRMVPSDAAAVARLVAENREHLRPHMPWASDDASADEAFQRSRIEQLQETWATGDDFGYALIDDQGGVAGSMSFFARRGPGTMEIGYWLAQRATGLGVATAGARALTDAIFAIGEVHTAIICCDAANRRSARVPRRLGYALDRVTADDPYLTAPSPADCGRTLFWHCTRSRWQDPPDADHVEAEALLQALAQAREAVVCAVAGAPDTALVTPGVASGTNLLGIVSHLGAVERHWFIRVFRGMPADTDFSMNLGSADTAPEPTEVINAYLEQARSHDDLVRNTGDLSTRAAQATSGITLRRILTHLITETARHAGHADILREQADGSHGI